ncbi:MAG TPA: hypothetical protein VEP90_09630 [Methylomirabilota bacterium]|nr:hypothetical protein [Methylomirabilota bacterium]
MSKTVIYCTQCNEPILPGELYLDEFMVGKDAPIHQECVDLWMEDEDRRNFWFDQEYLKNTDKTGA